MRFSWNGLRTPVWAGLLLATSIALSGCHHDRSAAEDPPSSNNPPTNPPTNPPPTDPPPPTNTAPTAAFTVADTAPLNTPVIFDASASTTTNGDLQYYWDFGGGRHGGGKVIARMFAASGATSVTLTVVDAGGHSATQSKTITISAPTTTPAMVTAQGSIQAVDGTALQGVSVTPFGASTSGTTDANGKVNVSVAAGAPLSVKLSKDGYADQFVSLTLPAAAGSDAYFEAVMRPRDAALTLADAAAGGSLNGRDGAAITLPANALVDSSGTAVTGAVQIAMTPVNVTDPGAGGFPGSFDGITPSGAVTPIVSFGTTEYVLSANGNPLQLAPGKTAVIEVPLYATASSNVATLKAGDTTPLWSLDEATGTWVQEGEGTVVASTSSPSGLAMRATVSHFTWWNSDLGFTPFGPKPSCRTAGDIGIPGAIDSFAAATICNMLAEIDRHLGGNGTGISTMGLNASKVGINAEVSPLIAGYARRAIIPVTGGPNIPVPPNVDVALSATALNGTWTGRTVVNGGPLEERDVVIEMRPLQTTGPDPDVITLPFDGQRSLETNQTALFNFDGTALKYVRITVTPVQSSTLVGNVRLLQGQTVLGTAAYGGFNPQPITTMLPSAGRYTVEVTGTFGTPGGYRLQVELLGTSSSETVTVPYRADRVTLPQLTSLQKSFTVTTPYTAHVAFEYISGDAARAALVGPNGLIYNFASVNQEKTDATVVELTPGTYSLNIGSGKGDASRFSAKIEETAWAQVGPPLDGITDVYGLVGVVADTNGRPVVGYTRDFTANSHLSSALLLKRWTGSAWENVGTELTIDYPCIGYESVEFVMDSTNAPVVIYNTSPYSTGVQTSYTVVRRFSDGAWQPVGPNDGKLPHTDASYNTACELPPVLRLDSHDHAVVAYQSVSTQYVQRFDGTNWVDVVAGSTFSASDYTTLDLQFDASDRLWAVIANTPHRMGQVLRLNSAPTPAWETFGPNSGTLPSAPNVGEVYSPRLRFDATGSPVISATASIGTTSYSGGIIVYRYNGSAWSTTGGYQPAGPNSRLALSRAQTFTLLNGEPIVAWINNFTNADQNTVLMVQRNTTTGWTPIGLGDGRVPQFTPDNSSASPNVTTITQRQASQPRLVTIGNDVYMAVDVGAVDFNSTTPRRVYLLKKTGD